MPRCVSAPGAAPLCWELNDSKLPWFPQHWALFVTAAGASRASSVSGTFPAPSLWEVMAG